MEWIPCSKGLPKEDGRYYVTENLGRPCVNVLRFTTDLHEFDEYDFPDEKKVPGFLHYDSEWGYTHADYVTAWMPLPVEPYTGE